MNGPVLLFIAVAAGAAVATVLWARYRGGKSDRVSAVGSPDRRDDGGNALPSRSLRGRPLATRRCDPVRAEARVDSDALVSAAIHRQERVNEVSVRSYLADMSRGSSPDVGDES